MFEREGLPTACLSSARDVTERVRPPRSAFLNFPLGNQVGRPGDPEGQRAILWDALRLIETATEPGAIVDLPHVWPEPGWEAEVVARYRAEAEIVRRQRLAGEYDRIDPELAPSENWAIAEAQAVRTMV